MEANEIPEFSDKMKEGGEHALNRTSLSIMILAVFVAIVTVLGHRSHTEAVLMQARAADQWSEYQAKKIRSYEVSTEVTLLSLQPNSNAAAVETKIKEDKGVLEKWNKDLEELQKGAREFETEVKRAELHANRFDLGEALLQIAVVLASITLLTRRNTYYYLGLILGAAGLLCAASALLVH